MDVTRTRGKGEAAAHQHQQPKQLHPHQQHHHHHQQPKQHTVDSSQPSPSRITSHQQSPAEDWHLTCSAGLEASRKLLRSEAGKSSQWTWMSGHSQTSSLTSPPGRFGSSSHGSSSSLTSSQHHLLVWSTPKPSPDEPAGCWMQMHLLPGH